MDTPSTNATQPVAMAANKRMNESAIDENELSSKRQKTSPPGPPSLRLPTTCSDMVQVFVGQEKTPFMVFRSFLLYHSSYFRAALKESSDKQPATRVITLDQATPEVFGLFLEIIYMWDGGKNIGFVQPVFRTMLDLWIFADSLGAPLVQNKIMTDMMAASRDVVEPRVPSAPFSELRYVYEHTSSGSLLRKAAVDLCCRNASDEANFYTKHKDLFSQEILLELCDAYLGQTKGLRQAGEHLASADYHVNEDPELDSRIGEEKSLLLECSAESCYLFSEDPLAWVNKGKGVFSIWKHRETGLTRVVLRSSSNGILLFDKDSLSIFSYELMENKVVLKMACADAQLEKWVVCVQTAEIAQELKEILNIW